MSLGWVADIMVPVLQPISDRSPSQRWSANFEPNPPIYGNPEASGTLWCENERILILGESNAPAILEPGSQVAGTEIGMWNLIPYGDFFAFQYSLNPDQNLNVAGVGPYPAGTAILGWDWGGGAPNELWKFVEFD
jgi:hypothetical protein